jgi:SAM-dependent methyltransferase
VSLPRRPFSAALYRLSVLFTWRGLTAFLNGEYARIPSGARVLTVGAGGPFNDLLSRHAAARGFAVTSFDIDPDRGPDVVGDICRSPFRPESFDAVVVGEVLEHVQAPHLAIDNLHRLLAPGGSLILTTPFIFPIHDRPHDYYRFTRYGLAHLLREFTQVRITPRSSWAETINALGVRLALEQGTGARLAAPMLILGAISAYPFAWLLGRLIRTDFITLGYLVTARKS